MYSFMGIDSSRSLISMTKVFIPTINHSQSWPPCLHLMDETPLSCAININQITCCWLHKCWCFVSGLTTICFYGGWEGTWDGDVQTSAGNLTRHFVSSVSLCHMVSYFCHIVLAWCGYMTNIRESVITLKSHNTNCHVSE